MKQILKLLVFACCCCHIKGVIHAGKCADGWLEYGSYCYLFNSEQQNKNWKDSLLTCQSYGGNLLSIKDEGENLFILNQLKTNAMKNNPYWIGLSKLNGERKFMWSDNTSLLFVYWKANEPNNYNNSNEDCVEVNVYGWNDSPCNYIRGFICKAKLDTQMDSCIHGLVEKDILNISLQLNGNGFNVIEYFFPLFVTFTSESIQHGFIKPNSAQFKYIFSGYFNTNGANIHNVTLKVNKRNCFRDFLIEIPVKLSYQNKLGILKVVTMAYQKSFTCLYKVLPKIPRDKNALSEYYGRGIYIDNEKFDFYFCVNQHVESTVPACYYSEIHDGYGLWTDLDVRVGCVLGHHLVTKELWAIHRNQQSYLYFHGFYGKWLAVSKGDNIAANNFNKSMRMSLEDDEDQVYTFGSNQWMGNAEGLFYRNGSLSSWLQKVRWTL